MSIRLIVASVLLASSLSSCKVGRYFVYNFADIKDYKKFPSRTISQPEKAFTFHVAGEPKKPQTIGFKNKEIPFEQFLDKTKTVAFLVIQRDTIKYETYLQRYDETSVVPSFSMAKSVISILIGIALEEGYIQSLMEPITNYIPELIPNGFEKVRIEHLLQMTSGLKFNEGYANPFGDVATFYYGTNLRKAITKMKLKHAPGTKFEYQSGNTQLLGLVLERALGGKTISAYLEEKIWRPLGMEFSATWSVDRKKESLEKAFCCLNARARDYAKIGRLYLKHGDWNGQRIVSPEWVSQSTKIDTSHGSAWYYQYQWWLPTQKGDFTARGILGQYIYVNPEKELIIVRLGKAQGGVQWMSILPELAKGY
jgi:CubicO group peptidase (beta-lactamase class C family)